MKKALCSKLPAFGVLFLFTAILSLTSCENFLKSEQVKNDILSAIDYNNAKSYTIRVEAAKGSGVIRIPAEGSVVKKVTDTFTVKFDPDDSCKFTGWTVQIPDLPQGQKASDYIEFEEPLALETKVTLKKAHNSIVIVASCPAIPTATVNLEGSHGKFSPAKGELFLRQGVPVTISFEPDSDYDFIKWKLYDSTNGTEYNSSEYLELAHPDRPETECLLLNAPEASGNIKLCLEPVIVKRPRVISATPQWDSLGSYRDARIQVIFDQTIDKNSIYLTDNEKDKLVKEGITGFLPQTQTDKKYGYIKDGKQYYKNIQIDNQKTGESILEYFGDPYFEDDITLIIPPLAENPPPGNTKITVTLENGFSYENKKSVLLKEDYKWLYFVNSRTDNLAPTRVTENIMNVKGNASAALSVQEASPTILFDQKLQMEIKIEDQGSGPLGIFKLRFTDLANSETKIWEEIGFDSVTDDSAKFGSSTEYSEYLISEVPDGNYKLNIIYYDKNLNATKDTEDGFTDYYVTIDATAPVVSNISFQTVNDSASEANNQTAQILGFSCTDANFDKVVVNYKQTGSDNCQGNITSHGTGAIIIPYLTHGKDYQFELTFYDKAENKTVKTAATRTELGVVQNAAVTTEQNQANNAANVHLTWDAPDGDFDSYTVEWKQNGSSDSAQSVTLQKNATSYDIQSLPFAANYTFKIKTNQNGNASKEKSLEKTMPIHRVGIAKLQVSYSSSKPYIEVKSDIPGSGSIQGATNYTAKLYYSESEFTTDNVQSVSSIDMINGGMLGYSTSYNNTKIKTGSESCNFEFGNKYWFAIMITDGTQKSWSTVKSLDLDYKVTNLRMDYVTGTKCKIIWDYPEFPGTFNVNIYRNTPGGAPENRNSAGYLSQVTSSGHNYYLIDNLTPNTEYKIEVKLTYHNTESFSTPIIIKTLDIQKLANFAVAKSEPYADKAAGLTFRANAENYIIVIEGKPVRDNDFGYVFPDDEGDAAVAAQLAGLVWNGSGANWDLWFHGSSMPYTSDELVGYCKFNNGNLECNGRFIYTQSYDFRITAYQYNSSTGEFTTVSTDCIIYTP